MAPELRATDELAPPGAQTSTSTRIMPGYRWLPACLRRSALSRQLSCSRCRGRWLMGGCARLCVRSRHFRYTGFVTVRMNARRDGRGCCARSGPCAVVLDLGDHLALGGVTGVDLALLHGPDRLAIRRDRRLRRLDANQPIGTEPAPRRADHRCGRRSARHRHRIRVHRPGTDRCQGEPAGETDRAEVRAPPARHGWTRDRTGRERALRGCRLSP